MKTKEPKNSNYCATVVKISTLKPLENADRVQGAIIFGNQVVVSLETEIGDVGLYFPLETQLSHEFCHANNLYRHKHLNSDETVGGYFEDNRRIKCVKFRGNKSEGFFIPLHAMDFTNPVSSTIDWDTYYDECFPVGMEFDEYNDLPICNKYVPKRRQTQGQGGNKTQKKAKNYEDKLVDNQFRFHQDTSMLYKNLHRFKPSSLISITYKLHGTSGISSKVLHKRKLSIWDKVSKFFGANIQQSEYRDLCSSRKVIKTLYVNPKSAGNHYYQDDIWTLAHKRLDEFLEDGMTLYYEIVGYLPSGGMIQKDYDYGCEEGTFDIYIYRITYTNPSGKVFEFSAKQVQDWCHFRGLKAVPQLFYGTAGDFHPELANRYKDEEWRPHFLEAIKDKYNDKNCYMCTNKVPEEGVVIRIESNDLEAFKQKSFKFYEKETKDLDKGIVDIETDN